MNSECVSCGQLYDKDSFDSCPSCEKEFDDNLEGKKPEEAMAERMNDIMFEKPDRKRVQDFSDNLKEGMENEPDFEVENE
jgi:hypothetical protein